ncbi:unnamed protein product [Dibothriocephalus latus]|uniref:Uncharacterized protein n=1 Tax=Dibothriocephalus latus TaxID=60516 RepID=A0A3P6RAD6_DIBLA|nr:unnamed protein product [Dibothriocephalus latus]
MISALSLLLLPQRPAPALLLSVGSIYLEVDIPSSGEAPTSSPSAKSELADACQTRARLALDLEFCHLKALQQLTPSPTVTTSRASPLLAYSARKSSSLDRHVYGDLLMLNDFSVWVRRRE